MKPFPIATCFLKLEKVPLHCRFVVFLFIFLSLFLCLFLTFWILQHLAPALPWPYVIPCLPVSRILHLPWDATSSFMEISRGHGYPSSTTAPSDSLTPSRSDTDPTTPNAGPSFPPAGPGDYTSPYGYSTADLATPIPAPADHQTPILPRLAEKTYPLQRELAGVRRQLHAYYFVEVQSPHDDNTQPALRRLMMTEVDRRGNHRNRQPEFFFNGIIGHIRAGQNGWIDSWDQSS